MTPMTVGCRRGAGCACTVTVGDDAGATHHEVTSRPPTSERLAPGAADPKALVRASFEFLLAREPRESILRRSSCR